MFIEVRVGDLLDESADAIITTANPFLNMSGGVNGAILLRGGESVQDELRAHLRRNGTTHVPPGSVFVTGPGPLRAKWLLHAVALDAFYDSSKELVAATIVKALDTASELGCNTVSMPTLATGYGPLSYEDFGESLAKALNGRRWPFAGLVVVVRRVEAEEALRKHLSCSDTD